MQNYIKFQLQSGAQKSQLYNFYIKNIQGSKGKSSKNWTN